MSNKLNFVFFGTPDVASETLEILKQAGYLPSLIVTATDKPQGRKMLLTPPTVKIWAMENNIPFLQPEKIDEEFTLKLSTLDFQLSLVVAYGKILPEEILNIPKLGSFNIHYSLLPKYRGASPVESTILNGETKTGVTIQKMAFKMDAGAIVAQTETEIGVTETAPELRSRLIKIGGDLLVETLPKIIDGSITETEQNENEATFCKKIKKEDGQIDLDADPKQNYNKFRAYAHWPRTFFFKDGKRIIITDASLIDGKFVINKIIPEGGKETAYNPSTLV